MRRFEMDHSTRFSFFAFHMIYTRIAGYMCIGAVVMALTAAQLKLFWPAVCLTAAAVMSLSFTVWITWCYERYLHSKYPLNPPMPMPLGTSYVGPSNYTTIPYAITNLLAIVTLSTFAWGLVTMILGIWER